MNNFLRRKLRKGISFVAACAIMATNVSPWLVASYASEVPEEAYYEGADEDYEEASEEYFETPEVTMTPEAESADAYFEGSAEPTEAPSEAPDAADEAEYGLEETSDQEEAEVPDYEIDEMEDPDGDGIAEGVEASDEMFEEDAFEEDAFENDASEDDAETPDGQILENAPSVIFEESTEEVRVTVVAGLGVFPEGTTMEVKPAEDEETISKVSESVEDERTKVTGVKAVEVTFYNAEHEEIEPNGPVFVTLEDLTKIKENVAEEPAQKLEEAKAVHVTDEGECSMMAAASEEDLQYLPMEWEEDQAEDSIKKIEQLNEEATVAFLAESFSTYALVYTVDFHWEVDGQVYEYSLAGGDSVSFRELVAMLGIFETAESENYEVVEAEPAEEVSSEAEEAAPAEEASVEEPVAEETPTEESIPEAAEEEAPAEEIVEDAEAEEELAAVNAEPAEGLDEAVEEYTEENEEPAEVMIEEQAEEPAEEVVETVEEAVEAPAEAVVEEPAEVAPVYTIDDFIDDVESIEFSDESLVCVAKVDEGNTFDGYVTAGELKEMLGLECEYSAELTENQLRIMNEKEYFAPDWVLISLRAFNTEESLVVMMKNGESFEIRVTDGQIKKTVLSASGDTYEVIVTYGDDAGIPDEAELKVEEILPEDEAYQTLQEKAGEELEEELENVIPAHPTLFDISIYDGNTKIEPAEGSSVQVEIRLVKSSMTGVYTDSSSPLLINDEPLKADEQEVTQSLKIIHDVENGSLDMVNIEESESEESIVGKFETESFSNWLLFLDESIDVLNVYQGDNIILRPYAKWFWKADDPTNDYAGYDWDFPETEYNLTYGTTDNIPIDYNNHTTSVYGLTAAQLKNDPYYTFVGSPKYDRELVEWYRYYTLKLPDNAPLGSFNLYVKDGNNNIVKTIPVNVLPKSQSPGDPPDELDGVDNIVVNLFDYDLGGVLDVGRSGNEINKNLSGGNDGWPFDDTINKNHLLKFLSSGKGGEQGSFVNHYKKNIPNQGIVDDKLDQNHFPTIKSEHNNNEGSVSLAYLFDTTKTEWGTNKDVIAYPNVSGMFQQDNKGYYYYNSNSNYFYYDPENKESHLYERTYSQYTDGTSDFNGKPIGFFPFHEYNSTNYDELHVNQNYRLNHHFGMSMEVPFALPADKKLENGEDIIYDFSGDDDLWVFIDDDLALDIGGIHQPIRGYINFTTGKVYVYGVNDSVEQEVDLIKNMETGKEYKLRMFYLERGGCDSNLSVRFNIPVVIGKTSLHALKEKEKDNPNAQEIVLEGAQFGLWENAECSGPPLRIGTSDGTGDAGFDDVPILENGQVYYMKEIKAPNGYYLNKTIFKVTAVKDNEGHYSFDVTRLDEGNVEFNDNTVGHRPIIYDKPTVPIALTVQKQWVGDIPANASATFELKRYKTYEGYASTTTTKPKVRLNVLKYTNTYGWTELITSKDFVGGSIANITWDYHQYLWNDWKNGNYKLGNIDATVQSSTSRNIDVELPNSGEYNVYLFDGNLDNSTEAYRQYGVVNVQISGDTSFGTITTTDYEHLLKGENEPDNSYTGPTVTLPHDGGWSYNFDAQPASGVNPDTGITEYYTYYIVETSCNPTGYLAAYDKMTGDKITGSYESETRTITNYRNEVYVEKRWYGIDGNLLDPQPTDTVSATLSSNTSGAIQDNATKSVVAGTKTVWNVVDDAEALYTAVENPVPDGYDVSYSFRDVGESNERSEGGVYRQGTIYINNRKNVIPFSIKKIIKGTNTPLAGAEFTLTKVDNYRTPIQGEEAYFSRKQTVDSNTGIINFGLIKAGHYELKEVTVPDGFLEPIEGPYYFTISTTGVITLDENYELIKPSVGEITFIVENEPGEPLPETGGPGTRGFLYTGLALIFFATLFGLAWRRKRI